jgi:NDP-sugar pyrophosphorylase family protein
MRVVILAGGKGTRLRPYTNILPKPLLPVGERPVIEILIKQLHDCGFDRVTLALGHMAHLFKAVLGDGEKFGLKVEYAVEDSPLGTSGPLSKISGLDEPFLVCNGDVLTNFDFSGLMEFHRSREACMTIASHKRRVEIDYGVVRRSGAELVRYVEKPSIDYEVSMGIYAFDPRILRYIPDDSHLDFPDLVRILMDNEEKVLIHTFDGIWFDLGRIEDFQRVQDELIDLKKVVPFL